MPFFRVNFQIKNTAKQLHSWKTDMYCSLWYITEGKTFNERKYIIIYVGYFLLLTSALLFYAL